LLFFNTYRLDKARKVKHARHVPKVGWREPPSCTEAVKFLERKIGKAVSTYSLAVIANTPLVINPLISSFCFATA
jgi:hypothetical protein